MPSSLIHINNRPLFIETTGSGPPLIVLHGLGGSTNLFPLATNLAAFFTVIRFDFEGAGKSPLDDSTSELKMDSFVEDVKAVLEWAGFEGVKSRVFGHSLGAAVALHFAATYPNLVHSLVLSCPSVARSESTEGRAASRALAATAREKTPFNMADFTSIKNTSPNASLLARALVRTAMQESTAEGYAKTCEMIAVTPSPDWRRITSKVLVIAGKYDQISSVEAGEAIARCLVEAESVKVETVEAGHQPAVEVPDVVLALLQAFFQ
ncbi:hypothetical protein P7C70_g1791, partial [Phenoliferia sp. Uapishka_3]